MAFEDDIVPIPDLSWIGTRNPYPAAETRLNPTEGTQQGAATRKKGVPTTCLHLVQRQ